MHFKGPSGFRPSHGRKGRCAPLHSDRAELLGRLLDAYAGYFDIERESPPEGFEALASFHSRSERYVLVKSAQLWAAEANEYSFFASVERLGIPEWQSLRDSAIAEGLSRITPHREHMYSYITLIILADQIDPEAAREMRFCRFHKSFRLSFFGWTDLRVAALEFSSGKILTNRQGKELSKTLERVCK